MSQRAVTRVVGAIALVLTAMVGCSSGDSNADADNRPNIVFILADDLDARLLEDNAASFPAFQKLLADEGTSFTNYFVSDSLCCPSRATTLRGQYDHNTGITGNSRPEGGYAGFYRLGREDSTVAVWLRAAGYYTGLFGKYLNGYPETVADTHIPPGWDEFVSPNGGNPYVEFQYELNDNGKTVAYGSAPNDYLVDVLSSKTVDFIRRRADKEPFFAYVAPYVPHGPSVPAPRYADALPGLTQPPVPSFDEGDLSDKPPYLQARPGFSPSHLTVLDTFYRARVQSMLAVDDMIRRIVETLQDTGELDNTYIVFTSDNGFHLGQHRLGKGKQTAYDEDVRVPLTVRGPKVAADATIAQLAVNTDLAPTFATIGGAKAPDFVDGRSLLPLLTSPSRPLDWRNGFLIEHVNPYDGRGTGRDTAGPTTSPTATTTTAPVDPDNPDPSPQLPPELREANIDLSFDAIPTYTAIRTADYLYVEYDDGARELYDVRADPYALDNQVGTAPESQLRSLSGRLEELRTCRGQACRDAEDRG